MDAQNPLNSGRASRRINAVRDLIRECQLLYWGERNELAKQMPKHSNTVQCRDGLRAFS